MAVKLVEAYNAVSPFLTMSAILNLLSLLAALVAVIRGENKNTVGLKLKTGLVVSMIPFAVAMILAAFILVI